MSAEGVVSAAVAAGADNAVIVAIVSEFDRQPPEFKNCTECEEWQQSVATLSARLLSGLEIQLSNARSSPDPTKGSLDMNIQRHKTSLESAQSAFAGASGILSPAISKKTITNSVERVAILAAAHEALSGCGKCKNHVQLSKCVTILDKVIQISNPNK